MESIKKWQEKFESYFEYYSMLDAGHDLAHFKRVWKTANNIATDGCDFLVILAASYFHDLVNYPKNHPKRSFSSKESADKAEEILLGMDFPKEKLNNVIHSILAHSYSANIIPETIEAKIVQDADRMEALGAIGLARIFYISGKMGTKLFDESDPFAKNRELDDKKYALDHFFVKLLKLPGSMQTDKGKEEAKKREKILLNFIEDLKIEI